MLDDIMTLLSQFEDVLMMIGIVSSVVFIISLLLIPYLLGLIPSNYFLKNSKTQLKINKPFDLIKLIIKTLIGFILLIAGIIMLVTPGQGLISILLGLFLMEFPGKRQLELKLINHHPIFKTLNWLRSKVNKPPFKR
ncbi:hypothetical protein Rmag_0719 [Candidatus Ruthia magnifica str. Cm (Calyptogena magnifica)]|uniref:Transmembrane protein (PGPGW) n=1 Tax=Ruthia magnifica subsp. Calyptogena magnifica TaxID=413404 RepID=A1AWZ4_RUTMC|nr:PGPGW domain-containing protein [Candidatus Ruthturnera calyptogenae]ABL02451.1 hypothetical protein Rmag_0719 [Candidatus Ruthia magnifica str. Cm (Calyptogena magnifica)]